VFKEFDDVPEAEQAKRFSEHEFFSGKILFRPDTNYAAGDGSYCNSCEYESLIFL
jgi:hypothetical protein